jgi:hypothetical protein
MPRETPAIPLVVTIRKVLVAMTPAQWDAETDVDTLDVVAAFRAAVLVPILLGIQR